MLPKLVASKSEFNTMKSTLIRTVGKIDSNTFVTIGGTPAGILIVQPLSFSQIYTLPLTKPTIIAENTPCALSQVAGIALTSSVVVPRGVMIKKLSNAIIAAEIPSSDGRRFFTK